MDLNTLKQQLSESQQTLSDLQTDLPKLIALQTERQQAYEQAKKSEDLQVKLSAKSNLENISKLVADLEQDIADETTKLSQLETDYSYHSKRENYIKSREKFTKTLQATLNGIQELLTKLEKARESVVEHSKYADDATLSAFPPLHTVRGNMGGIKNADRLEQEGHLVRLYPLDRRIGDNNFDAVFSTTKLS
ncbi:MAG: hypothetical protein KC422_24990 [Trueperaceae bacterium]|nr:hypothetical protein [Trueperaceae bacterium]